MSALPAHWTALASMAFLFGVKHGFDADHLATIDGLTRVTRGSGAAFSPYCGALFSLGHGAVVVAIAALVGSTRAIWAAPAWLEVIGAWISIAILTFLGILNIRAVLCAAPLDVVAPVAVKGRLLGRMAEPRSPWLVMAIGAAFALSFDTVSQTALFAATAVRVGGVEAAVALAVLCLLGMLMTDGVSGLWVSRLIARADALARVASRVMGLGVGGVSLLVAGIGTGCLASSGFARWTDDSGSLLGAAVVAILLASFILGRRLAGLPALLRNGPAPTPRENPR